ncbi:MAG: hypothetical protein O8C63_00080 [Candidatus Methanoperedens sp.]|nr:hypothetical protein [Candidatus Methanoperedens sp.]
MKSESGSTVVDDMPVDINEVRSRLAKISGSLSQEIIEGRAERT